MVSTFTRRKRQISYKFWVQNHMWFFVYCICHLWYHPRISKPRDLIPWYIYRISCESCQGWDAFFCCSRTILGCRNRLHYHHRLQREIQHRRILPRFELIQLLVILLRELPRSSSLLQCNFRYSPREAPTLIHRLLQREIQHRRIIPHFELIQLLVILLRELSGPSGSCQRISDVVCGVRRHFLAIVSRW